jgi:site-specific recombinase XerD
MTDTSGDAWQATWESYLRSWIRHVDGRQVAKNTIRIYTGCGNLFVDFLGRLPTEGDHDVLRPDDAEALRRAHVELFLAHRGAKGDKPSYVHQHWRNLRAWCNYLVFDEVIDRSPMRGLKEPIVPEKTVPVMPDEQIAALFTACKGRGFTEVRDTAIIRLLFSTGCRREEIGRLEVTDLDMGRDEIHVEGKGRKDRYVPFGAKTGQALEKYLRLRGKQQTKNMPELWLAEAGRGALSPSGVGQMLKRRARQAGIGHVHPHLFRHKFADDWQRRDGNTQDLKRLMGWNSDAMLARYAASSASDRARNAHRRMRLDDRL